MDKTTATQMLSMCHDPEQAEKDLRRSQAVVETKRLKRLLQERHISQRSYLAHLRDLSAFIVDENSSPRFDAPVSRERIKAPALDTILLDYLTGSDGDDEYEEKRVLGTW